MNATRNAIQQRLSRFQGEVKGLDLAREALKAFDICEAKEHLQESELQPLVVAASSTVELAYGTGAELLMALAMTKREAQECLCKLARDRKGHVRFTVLCYLYMYPQLPESVIGEIITLGLQDRSGKVRRHAIDRVHTMRLMSFLPQLEAMRKTETDAKISASLDFYASLLRYGYFVKRERESFILNVALPNGIVGKFIPAEEYSAASVPQLVVQLRRENDLARMHHEWRCTKVIKNGLERPVAPDDSEFCVLFGTIFRLRDGKPVEPGAFKVVLTDTPNGIDLIALDGSDQGKKMQGIYEIEAWGRTLKLCLSKGSERPKDFSPNPQTVVIEFVEKERV